MADKKLVVRDVSFLNFPAYSIYIPGMSEGHRIRHEECDYLYASEKVFRCLYRLTKCAEEELKECGTILEKLIRIPVYYSYFTYGRNWYSFNNNMILDEGADFNILVREPSWLLCVMYLRLGDYKKGYDYYKSNHRNAARPLTADHPYFVCAELYICA